MVITTSKKDSRISSSSNAPNLLVPPIGISIFYPNDNHNCIPWCTWSSCSQSTLDVIKTVQYSWWLRLAAGDNKRSGNYICSNILFLPLLSLNSLFHLPLLGVNLSLQPQQGHDRVSQLIKILHIWHRFWPLRYLPPFAGFLALYFMHNFLQAIMRYQYNISNCV